MTLLRVHAGNRSTGNQGETPVMAPSHVTETSMAVEGPIGLKAQGHMSSEVAGLGGLGQTLGPYDW